MKTAPVQLVLYVKPGCHLCDEARETLALTLKHPRVAEKDITGNPGLFKAFGTRIPVLARADTGEELQWPFGPADIKRLTSAGP